MKKNNIKKYQKENIKEENYYVDFNGVQKLQKRKFNVGEYIFPLFIFLAVILIFISLWSALKF